MRALLPLRPDRAAMTRQPPPLRPGRAGVMRARLVVAGLVLALAPARAHAAEGSVGGFAEVRFSGSPGLDGTPWRLIERVRPRFRASLHQRISLFAEVEFALVQGRDDQAELQRTLEDSDFGPLLALSGIEWPEKANSVLQIDGTQSYLDVARLYVDFYLPGADLRVGRQALFWGSAAMINPTDPFPELLVTEPWKPRRGTNAVRANIPLGEGGDLTAVLATSDLFDALRAAARLRVRLGPADLAFVAAYRGDDDDGLIGIDLRGSFGVGYWVEAAIHIDGEYRHDVAVGLDYSSPVHDGLVVMAQYYRNGRGAGPKETPPNRMASLLDASGLDGSGLGGSGLGGSSAGGLGGGSALGTAPEQATFAPLFSGRDYVMLSLSQAFIPEISVSAVALQNLSDGTGFFIPTVSVRPLDWLDLSLSAQVPYRLWGEGGEFKPNEEDLQIEAEVPFLGTLSADLRGLVPDATITFWTRASF